MFVLARQSCHLLSQMTSFCEPAQNAEQTLQYKRGTEPIIQHYNPQCNDYIMLPIPPLNILFHSG